MDAPSVNQTCVVCKLPDQKALIAYTRTYEIHCERCGKFKFSQEALYDLNGPSDGTRPIISEWIYEQNELGMVPTIGSADIPALLGRRRLTFRERAKRLLVYFAQQNQFPEVGLKYDDLRLHAVLQTYDEKAIEVVCKYFERGKSSKNKFSDFSNIDGSRSYPG